MIVHHPQMRRISLHDHTVVVIPTDANGVCRYERLDEETGRFESFSLRGVPEGYAVAFPECDEWSWYYVRVQFANTTDTAGVEYLMTLPKLDMIRVKDEVQELIMLEALWRAAHIPVRAQRRWRRHIRRAYMKKG